jgi:hypothetical protein
MAIYNYQFKDFKIQRLYSISRKSTIKINASVIFPEKLQILSLIGAFFCSMHRKQKHTVNKMPSLRHFSRHISPLSRTATPGDAKGVQYG